MARLGGSVTLGIAMMTPRPKLVCVCVCAHARACECLYSHPYPCLGLSTAFQYISIRFSIKLFILILEGLLLVSYLLFSDAIVIFYLIS